MNFKNVMLSSAFLKILFVVLIFVLIFISSITYKNTLQVSNSTRWVMHSYRVHLELDQLMLLLKDAETGQRGFILTHQKSFLQPYIGSKQKARQSLVRLKKLSTDNPKQLKNIEKLHQLIESRYAYMRYSMYQDSIGAKNRANLMASLNKGRFIMDSMQVLTDKMIELEEQYLIKRNQNYQSNITVTPLLILLITLFSLVIFIISYIKINRDLSILKEANKLLIIANESNQHAEKIGDFCTSVWHLGTEKRTFSNNLYPLLGCQPNSFDISKENFYKFIHPDDKAKIMEDTAKIANGEIDKLTHFFRIIREDGQLRYFKSIARTIEHNKDEKTIISIISDITDQHDSQVNLEKRNFELEQMNTELESFNHVSSHDLQEPLRKIQLFLSRISDADRDAISEAGKEYLTKIQLAANRMRRLIDDLLAFSKANKADKTFENKDLNELLNNAKLELAVDIQEKNATINAQSLPSAKVIPYQIQQLFTNLIGNSLKYSKPDIAPVISIHCDKILVAQTGISKTNPEKEYYRIVVEDNGIGFDPQFSESIFNLFHRLHTSSEFPGTGIGLAICKKIVENHMGVIKAEGELGVGSIFTIFLPA